MSMVIIPFYNKLPFDVISEWFPSKSKNYAKTEWALIIFAVNEMSYLVSPQVWM